MKPCHCCHSDCDLRSCVEWVWRVWRVWREAFWRVIPSHDQRLYESCRAIFSWPYKGVLVSLEENYPGVPIKKVRLKSTWIRKVEQQRKTRGNDGELDDKACSLNRRKTWFWRKSSTSSAIRWSSKTVKQNGGGVLDELGPNTTDKSLCCNLVVGLLGEQLLVFRAKVLRIQNPDYFTG